MLRDFWVYSSSLGLRAALLAGAFSSGVVSQISCVLSGLLLIGSLVSVLCFPRFGVCVDVIAVGQRVTVFQ